MLILCFTTVLLSVDGVATDKSASKGAEVERPNVLLIITDDQNDYALEASGMPVSTPHLDRLKKQAINFPKAYCASPVCGPSRASLFSGLYPHNTGAYLNGSDPWKKSKQLMAVETLPELFRRGGYHSWGMGKLYHAKLPDSRGAQWDNDAKANGGFAPFGDKEHQLAGKFFSVQEWDGPDGDFPDVKSANEAATFLSKRESEQPFFMVYGLWRPHNPWTAPRRFFDLYDSEKIPFPPPGYSKDDMGDIGEEGRNLAAIFGTRWNQHGDSAPEDWKRVLHGYLACTSFADWNLGRVIEALDKSGQGDNTIVIVTADNGYHVGEKHHFGKSTLWEKSARVPLLIRLPGRRHAGRTCDATVGLIDIFPTLRAACGLPSPVQSLDGNDLTPLFVDPTAQWEFPGITTYGEGRFSLRMGQWRYIQYPDGREELYDHRRDHHEFDNLATDSKMEKIRARFRKFIPSKWMPSTGGRKG